MSEIDMEVSIGGVLMKNPVMPASGTFAEEAAQIFDLNVLGALVTKSVTRYPRMGNIGPRIAETTVGMINAVGIQSKGSQSMLNTSIPFYQQYNSPLIISISADTADEFIDLAQELSVPGVAALEINISCPNLEDDGRSYAMDPAQTFRVVDYIKKKTKIPLFAKLTPNTNAITEVAIAAEAAGADAVVVANTMLSMAIDVESRKPKIGNIMGGLSGPCIKPIILRMVYQVYKKVGIPIIGCGGICSAEDAIEYMMAGASAVQVGTYNFVNPIGMVDIIQGMKEHAIRHKISSLNDIVGSVCVIGPEDIDEVATY